MFQISGLQTSAILPDCLLPIFMMGGGEVCSRTTKNEQNKYEYNNPIEESKKRQLMKAIIGSFVFVLCLG